MKRFLKKTSIFLLSLVALSYIVVWTYEIPRREAIKNGTHDTQLKWQDIQHNTNTFSVIIVGSSRGDSGYNPTVIDSVANTQSYNLCSGSQNIVESYYILKEALQYHQPDYVIFDLFLPSFSDNPDFYHVLSNAEFMSTSSQWDMIVNGFGGEGIGNYLFPIIKYKSYLKNDFKQLFSVSEVVTKKAKRIQGFYYEEGIIDSASVRSFGPLYAPGNTTIPQEIAKKYLGLIATLCNDRNVQFIPVRAPYPPSRLANHPDPAHDYFKKALTDLKIPFYDFNSFSKTQLNDYDFSDDRHLNYKGARKVSQELGEIIKGMQ